MAYGYYKLFYGIREQHELAREKIWSRLHLVPLLQAEEDRDQVRRHFADKAREKELLGTESKVYNSDRYVKPMGLKVVLCIFSDLVSLASALASFVLLSSIPLPRSLNK